MTETIDHLIQARFDGVASSTFGGDWQDVLRRANLTSGRGDTPWRRPRLTRRRLVAAAVVVAALAVAAVAIADGPLLGLSNHGKRVYPGSYALHELHWHAGLWKRLGLPVPDTAKPGTFVQLALRQGIGVYAARSKKDNSLCFYTGRRQSFAGEPPNRLDLNGPGCGPFGGNFVLPERIEKISIGGRQAQAKGLAWLRAHPFPSPARPVLDMSGEGGDAGGGLQLGPVVGVAANSIHSIQLLAQSDCHPVVTVPVIDNVYIDAHPPRVAEAFLVARDAGGKVVWHSSPLNPGPYGGTPLDREMPRDCGLG
jgi:hypothetical protein